MSPAASTSVLTGGVYIATGMYRKEVYEEENDYIESWFRYGGCRGRIDTWTVPRGLFRSHLIIDASFFKLIFQMKEPGSFKMIYKTLVIVCKVETVRFIPVSTP
jgi:hypothetical protein